MLTQNGSVSGSGVVQIGKNATWMLNGSAAATDTITFRDTGAALSIGSSLSYNGTTSVSTPYTVNATITGFQTGDSIILAQPVSTATYTAGTGTNPGKLVLSNATGTIETLRLTGDFTGKSFFVSPTTTGGASISLLSQAAQGSGPKSLTSDSYTWIGPSGGSWGALGNWNDTTTRVSPAAYVPGKLTPVTIAGPTGSTFEVIAGGGNAASVGLTGNVSLAGSYTIGGAVTVGNLAVVPATSPYSSTTTTLTAGALMLSTGGTITAGTVNVLDGTLSLAGSTKLSATGSITLGVAGGYNVPYGGTYIYSPGATGSISLASGATLSTAGGLSVNSGSISLASGATLSTVGSLSGGLSDAGGVVNIGSTLTVGGAVAVTAGGKLTVGGGITEPSGIVFAGGAGSKLVASGTMTAAGGGSYDYSNGNSFSYPYSGNVVARDGGFVQLGGLILNAPPSGAYNFSPLGPLLGVSVDSTSTIEIGTTGGATVGAITIDAGKTVTSSATTGFSGNLVDNGILSITDGVLTQNGSVSGSGVVQIGKNATWMLNGSTAATDTITFRDTGAALSIGSSLSYNGTTSVSTPYTVNATITGFQTGDSIILAQPVSTATYTAGTGTNPGKLVLSNATGTIETLRLTGDFTGKSFFVSPTTTGGASISLLSQAAQGSGPKSLTSDSYTWIGPSGGSWGALGNWNDTTTGVSPAAYVPGKLTPVTIAGPTGSTFEVIAGGGNAASVGLTGNVSLAGSYTIGGAVTVGNLAVVPATSPYSSTTTTLTAGALMLSTGGTITAGTVNVLDGTLSLAGSTKLSATGSITLGVAGGYNVPYGGTYIYSPGATGAISLASGATLSTAGGLSVNSGSISLASVAHAFGGGQLVRRAERCGRCGPHRRTLTVGGQVAVTAGGKLTVGGGITEPSGIVFAGGAGSKLVASGTMTAAGGGSYDIQMAIASLTPIPAT